MRLIIYLLLFAAVPTNACKHQPDAEKEKIVTKDTAEHKVHTLEYPYRALVGFRQEGDRNRSANFRLGDSLLKVLKYLDLDTSFLKYNNRLKLKTPILKKCAGGFVRIQVLASFDKGLRLANFKVQFVYEGTRTKESRTAFGFLILDYLCPYLWEEGVRLNTPTDKCHIKYFDGHVDDYTLDCTAVPWTANYECRIGS